MKATLYEERFIWIPLNGLNDGLMRIDVNGQRADTIQPEYYMSVENISADSHFVWLSNRREVMAFDKQSEEAHFWSLPYKSSRNILYQDSKHIYLHDLHSIIIIPKSIVLKES